MVGKLGDTNLQQVVGESTDSNLRQLAVMICSFLYPGDIITVYFADALREYGFIDAIYIISGVDNRCRFNDFQLQSCF